MLLLIASAALVLAQDHGPDVCIAEEYDAFDFWVGEWAVTWANTDGTPGEGHNSVRRLANGCSIIEIFDAAQTGAATSQSYFDTRVGLWHQTFLDNEGNAIIVSGNPVEDGPAMILEMAHPAGGRPPARMVWEITGENTLEWTFQSRTADGGWLDSWEVRYTRQD